MDKFNGIAFVKITSAYPAGALQKIQDAGIRIYNVSYRDTFSITFSVDRKEVRPIVRICEKRGDRVDMEGWTGYIFYLWSLLKRPVFLAGLFGWLILALWLPTRILFVTVSGADSLPDAYILECAADCGIQMGASAKEVRSEKVKNALLSEIPELRWAGVNTSGCIATVYVQEKRKEDPVSAKPSVTDILSTQDAIVREITVQAGTPLCQPGQAVKKGQALISCYRDNGQVLEFTGAGGEIYGDTKRHIQAITPLQAHKRTRVLSNEENFYVVIGKNPINFKKDSGILDGSCVKMYEVKECVLPGGFDLPIWFVKEQIISYDMEPVILTDNDAAWLNDYAYRYLESSLVAGSILSENTVTESTEEIYRIHGIYDCYEMIADYEYKGTTEINGENG